MSEKFVASNGVEISRIRGEVTMSRTGSHSADYLYSDHEPALREFFLHERDKELGRLRWTENPDYVVYPSELYLTPPDADLVTVFNERTGQSSHCRREGDGNSGHFSLAARAYFAAHPEPKPWHDAKPGEVWELTYLPLGEPKRTRPFVVDSLGRFRNTQGVRLDPFQEVTDGRRIWPEVVSDVA